MLVNTKQMLNRARKDGYAIAQFNTNNLEWTKYILEECNELNAPVIIGVSDKTAKYMGGYKTVVNIIKGLIEDLNIKIEVAINLDHASSFDECKKAIDSGFTSVMIDASSKSIEDNINITKQVVEYAKQKNVTVEAEVGENGGIEDGMETEKVYASIEDCELLAYETQIDSLAAALGSVHGIYKEEPNLNFELMGQIGRSTKLPLVLHGGSGIDDNKIKTAILCGITKININTELQLAWIKDVKEYINNNPDVYHPRKVIGAGEKAIKEVIREKVILFGSNNKSI